MDPDNRITITVCGDGGCGTFCARAGEPIAFMGGTPKLIDAATGKSSITLRLVRSEWTHE